MKVSRRSLAMVVGAAAASQLPVSVSAQECAPELPVEKTPFAPDPERISPAVRDRLSGLLLRWAMQPLRADTGSNPDPEYNEFWLQMIPKGGDSLLADKSNPAARLAEQQFWQKVKPVASADFNEEVFAEIHPNWDQMCSPSGCDGGGMYPVANATVTMKAKENGKSIDNKAFYSEIFKALTVKKP